MTPAPTRQSTRGRKPAASSNADENASTEEAVTTTPAEPSSSSSSQRNKRQVATPANDVAPVNNEVSTTENTNEQEAAPAVDSGDNNVTESLTKASPSPGRKRGAPKSTPASAKKPKGQTADVEESVPAPAVEPVQTPPKKARTSVMKKTPEPPGEDYVRKLRPRK